jgi:protein-S-isoprenylcysteine O-methyltransferase Ste14
MVAGMSTDAAHKSWWQISEVVFGIPFLAALALQLVVPLSLPYGYLTLIIIFVGGVLIIIGAALIVLARREFARHGQHTDPGYPTTKIITTGVFSLSRNPIYLGAACFLIGIALAADLPWVLVLLLPALAACHVVLIAPEERYLAARFGEEYRIYAVSVHRWIGRARPRGSTTK